MNLCIVSAGTKCIRWIALAAIMLAAVAGESRAALQAFVLSNTAAPDGNGQFQSLNAPILNDAGQLAFFAKMTGTAGGTSSSDRNGVFRREANGTITQVARGLQAAPGGGAFSTFFGEAPYLNDNGQVAFFGGGSVAGMYKYGPSLGKVARFGEAPPDGNGVFSALDFAGFNDAGQVGLMATLSGTSPANANRAVYRGDGVTMVKIARRGDAAPGGATYTDIDPGGRINEAGEMAFSATLSTHTYGGILRGNGISTTIVAMPGQGAPGIGGGTDGTYGTMGTPGSISGDGEVAFMANINNPSHGGASAIIRGDGASSTLILRRDQGAPTASGGTLGVFPPLGGDRPVVNRRGDVALWIGINGTGGTSDRGLFIGNGPTLRPVIRDGELAPDGLGVFENFSPTGSSNAIINEAGQTAFYADQRAPSGAISRGLYFWDPVGGLTTIARQGQPLLGATISSLSIAGQDPAVPLNSMGKSGLNERGQVGFHFGLSNGAEGMAIWSPAGSDFNNDGAVNGNDLTVWRSNFGDTPATQADGDGTGDGRVDGADFLKWQRQVGSGGATAAGGTVPEPSMLLLAMIGMSVWSVRKSLIPAR